MANGTQYSFQRIEKKYFISPAQAETMLGEMRRHMTADRYGEYAIGNIYCDTDNFQLIRASLGKPAYKEKLRIRCYGVPKAGDKVFVELKKKCGGVLQGNVPGGQCPRTDDQFKGGASLCLTRY